jgi:hypothetical protein
MSDSLQDVTFRELACAYCDGSISDYNKTVFFHLKYDYAGKSEQNII